MSSEALRASSAIREIAVDHADSSAQRFSALYEQHADFVWRSARYLGAPPLSIEDAVQDVFLVVYRRFHEFEARSSPRTWLFAITLRVVSDHRRSQRRKTRLIDRLASVLPRSFCQTPFDNAARAETGELVLRALSVLSEEQRVAFIMADLEEMSAPEIAKVLNINLNTVYSRLRAARREVETQLRQHLGEPP